MIGLAVGRVSLLGAAIGRDTARCVLKFELIQMNDLCWGEFGMLDDSTT